MPLDKLQKAFQEKLRALYTEEAFNGYGCTTKQQTRVTAEIRDRSQQLQNPSQKYSFLRPEVILGMEKLNLDQTPQNINKEEFQLERVRLQAFIAPIDPGYEIITKVALLSFEIVASHNYAPLRSAIHVLETLREIFFWNGVQKPCPVSLNVRNTVKSLSFKSEFESWELKGLRSGSHPTKTFHDLSMYPADLNVTFQCSLKSPRVAEQCDVNIKSNQSTNVPSGVQNYARGYQAGLTQALHEIPYVLEDSFGQSCVEDLAARIYVAAERIRDMPGFFESVRNSV
ncbi:uncharacterized protein TNCV_2651901 [Trichonephila clavipes]|nr:uncharacterized protein TNCV_2651901 [Trichonephila clavipes]